MKEIHHDVELEPKRLPLTGESLHQRSANIEQDARANLRVRGFWTDG